MVFARVPHAGTPDPLPKCEALPPRQTPDIHHLLVGQQDLQPLAHTMSMAYS